MLSNDNLYKQHGPRLDMTKCQMGPVVQSVANPEVMSSIPARSHTIVEIEHEIISMVLLLPLFQVVLFNCLVKHVHEMCG